MYKLGGGTLKINFYISSVFFFFSEGEVIKTKNCELQDIWVCGSIISQYS